MSLRSKTKDFHLQLQTHPNRLTYICIYIYVHFCPNRPDLDDVIGEERVVFMYIDYPTIPCELQFQISTNFKIAAITLVCSAPKVELFVGPTQEYLETIYGSAVKEDDGDIPIRPYRYDVEIDRSGIADINLKLLTSAKVIRIYGAMLHIAPNPNGITTQLQKPFDIQKIQELLQKGGTGCGTPNQAKDSDQKLQKFMSMMKSYVSHSETPMPAAAGTEMGVSSLKEHIDAKFEQLERTIAKRLDAYEAQQAVKLDKIIAMLENKN